MRLLTALPLSNKAEFVTKMYAGIERKFNELLHERVPLEKPPNINISYRRRYHFNHAVGSYEQALDAQRIVCGFKIKLLKADWLIIDAQIT